MKTDISRWSIQPDQHYSGVYQQQGRMISDADWNELVEIVKLEIRDSLKDVIGSGSPQPVITAEGKIAPHAVMYVDGIRGVINNTNEPIAYGQQPDFPNAPPLPDSPEDYAFYVDLWERTVTGVEDPNLMDIGLNGADTCTRTQTLAQVKWCPRDFDLTTLPAHGDAKLYLTLNSSTADSGPCAEISPIDRPCGNLLFRFEVHDVAYGADLAPSFIVLKWSTENAAEHYRIGEAEPPPDFKTGDWVYEFYNEASEKHLGFHLANDFKPARLPLRDTYEKPSHSSDDARYVRRWDGYCELKKTYLATNDIVWRCKLNTKNNSQNAELLKNGDLTIKIGIFNLSLNILNNEFLAGDFWLAVVRQGAAKGQQVIVLNDGLPLGVVHHYLPLPVNGSDAEKRRFDFPPLTDLSANLVSYTPSDATKWGGSLKIPANLQDAIDTLISNQLTGRSGWVWGADGHTLITDQAISNVNIEHKAALHVDGGLNVNGQSIFLDSVQIGNTVSIPTGSKLIVNGNVYCKSIIFSTKNLGNKGSTELISISGPIGQQPWWVVNYMGGELPVFKPVEIKDVNLSVWVPFSLKIRFSFFAKVFKISLTKSSSIFTDNVDAIFSVNITNDSFTKNIEVCKYTRRRIYDRDSEYTFNDMTSSIEIDLDIGETIISLCWLGESYTDGFIPFTSHLLSTDKFTLEGLHSISIDLL
jgi:hypothetical protein